MDAKSLRQKVLAREPVFGGWVQVGHGTSAEILAEAGFDWVAVDMEHTDIGIAEFAGLARAIGDRTVALARVRENDTLAIRQVLDMGAGGVIVPLVNNAAEAAKAVAAARFPPEGVRGFAFTRANAWGDAFDEYAASANDGTLVITMVETREAIENIDAILEIEGLDGVMIGPYDLSGSYGKPGQTSAPEVVEGCKRVIDACAAAGKASGLHVVFPTPEHVRAALSDGHTFVALGLDTVFIREGARAALCAARG